MKSVSIQQIPVGRKLHQGFSLIEILVSVVVLSVGLIGLGGLQIAAIKGTNESHYRTEASLLMMDIADRIRANQVAVNAGQYYSPQAVNWDTPPAKLCINTACDAEQLATFDLYTIASKLRKTLPNGSLTITCSDATCNTVNGVRKRHNLKIDWWEAKHKSEDITGGDFKNKSIDLAIIP